MNLFEWVGAPMDLSWVNDSSSYDPSYPFVAYSYIIIIAIIIRIFLVFIPLFKLYRKYTTKRVKSIIGDANKMLSKSQKKQLIVYILFETFILLIPVLAALFMRGVLGPPIDFTWNSTTLLIGFVFGFLWLAIQFKQSIETRDLLKILNKRRYHPKLLNFALSSVTSAKKRLEKIIQFEPDYIVRTEDEIEQYQTMISRDDEGKINFDIEATKSNLSELTAKATTFAHNLSELAKSSAQKISKSTLEKFDQKVQNTIDESTTYSLGERMKSNINILMLSFGPLFVIYVILPWLS
ncbi:MAG: hypothetical protein VW862_05715 [Euryarchaeota archaeon]